LKTVINSILYVDQLHDFVIDVTLGS